MKTPDERAHLAIHWPVDSTSRASIVRARLRCATEARRAREQIELLAYNARTPDDCGAIRDAALRLERLLVRIETLGAMAKVALETEVANDPELVGAMVDECGRIVFPEAG